MSMSAITPKKGTADMLGYQMGSYGGVVTQTGATGRFIAIQVLEDADITTIEGGLEGIDLLNGATVVAGTVLYGGFTNIQISAGTIICYNA